VAFYLNNQTHWTHYASYFAHVFGAWLQDALLIWRYFFFWERKYYMLIVPIPLFITSIIIGCLLLAQIGHPGSSIWQRVTFNLFITFWGIELSTTIFVTTLIVGRLLYVRAKMKKIMGRSYRCPYLSIAAILIESGLMYSVGGIVFVICYTINTPFQNVILNAMGQVQAFVPVLIILRVAQGRGITKMTFDTASATLRSTTGVTSAVRLQNLAKRSSRTAVEHPQLVHYESEATSNTDTKFEILTGDATEGRV
ncbi:hypothetical protein EXIGLDRAFT_793567, partial [Exidia glandulosa HHB12029]